MCRSTGFEVFDAEAKLADSSATPNTSAEVAGASIASFARRGSYDLYQAARVHRATVIGSMVTSAARVVATIARRAYTRHVQHERARSVREALRSLDDRTLRDLGFHRSELSSASREWAEAIAVGVDTRANESASPAAIVADGHSRGAGVQRFPNPATITGQHHEERRMRPYNIATPRFAFALAAAAMTAITMGVMVVAPAMIETDREAGTLAASQILPAVRDGAVASSAIAVVALYHPWFAVAEASHIKRTAKRKTT